MQVDVHSELQALKLFQKSFDIDLSKGNKSSEESSNKDYQAS